MKFYLPERVGNQTTWQRNRQLDLSLNRRGERLQMPAGATPLKQCKYRRPQCLINANRKLTNYLFMPLEDDEVVALDVSNWPAFAC